MVQNEQFYDEREILAYCARNSYLPPDEVERFRKSSDNEAVADALLDFVDSSCPKCGK